MKALCFLARHGQAAGEPRILGTTDPPLGTRGMWQAQRLAQRLKGVTMECVWSSPLLRARQTAETIAGTIGAPLRFHPGLCEMDFGDWEGRSTRDVLCSEEFSRWARHPLENSPPGGESLLPLSERVLAAWKEVMDLWAGGNIVVVAHGGPLRILIGHLVGIPLEAIHRICQDHAGLSVVTMVPEPCLVLLNDPCHAQD